MHAAVLTCALVQLAALTLTLLTDVDRDAVCNDGSPAGYYYAPGSGDGVNLWLIYLEGARGSQSLRRMPR